MVNIRRHQIKKEEAKCKVACNTQRFFEGPNPPCISSQPLSNQVPHFF